MNASMCEIRYQNMYDSFAKNCIFMIECESNLKIYIDYASFRVVHSKVSSLVANAYNKSNKDYESDFCKSLRESKFINVSILDKCDSINSLIVLKYIRIKEYDALAPIGLNSLSMSFIKDAHEKDYVKSLIECNEYYASRAHNFKNCRNKKHKIAQINRETEIAIRIWDSLSQISLETGYRQGNISACCRGKLKSAYGFYWEFIEAD